MSRKWGLGIIGVALLVCLYVFFVANTPKTRQDDAAHTNSTSLKSTKQQPPAFSSAPVVPLPVGTMSGRVPIPSLRDRLLVSDDWKAEFARLDQASDVPLKERLFYKAVILEGCSTYKNAIRDQAHNPEAAAAGSVDRLKSFILGLAKDDRQKFAMDYSLRRKVWNLCRGFANTAISDDDIEKAYAAAAAAGHDAAQVRGIGLRLTRSGIENSSKVPKELEQYASRAAGPVGFPDPITSAEQTQLIGALFSGDPVAIRNAGEILSLGGTNQSLRVGPDQIDLGPHSEAVWTLAACEFGFECGARNMQVNLACAEQRQCSDDYLSYLRDHVYTPAEFTAVEAYARMVADAIRRRDFSAFQLVDRPGRNYTLLGGTPPRVRIR